MINISMTGVFSLPSVPSHHKDFLPEVSGLYFVITHAPEPQLVYLGKAKNFSQRWQNHHRQPEINLLEKLGLAVDIHWLELRVSDEILSQWENQLIKDLSPALNDTLTMTTEINRLENKISVLEEFAVEPSVSTGLLPDLSSISYGEILREKESVCDAESCPRCGSYNIKWLSRNAKRKQCKKCNGSWTVKFDKMMGEN